MDLKKAIIELYLRCATDLPSDAEESLRKALDNEDSLAAETLSRILENIKVARQGKIPICQDTGTPIFYINYPKDYTQKELKEIITKATIEATELIPLRPNAVDSITGINSKNNTGVNVPVFYFEEGDKLEIDLMLKGGGSENIGMIYKLPDSSLNAGRDIDGIRKCVLDAMVKAQGKGCAPNILGVAIGGSKDVLSKLSKMQLLRKLNDKNPDPELDRLEKKLTDQINTLGIGPNGTGGKTTCLGVKIIKTHRHPASFFVDVSFLCWAARRRRLIINGEDYIIE
ncbi:MAG: fumarate hydratase [Nanoarchaeota archaeon]